MEKETTAQAMPRGLSIEPVSHLILQLRRLPGIGERTATRLAYHVIKICQRQRQQAHISSTFAEDLAHALLAVQQQVQLCQQCHQLTSQDRCTFCCDPKRDHKLWCVVESIEDVRAIEACGAFRGLYHVLHGAIDPLAGMGPDALTIASLMARIELDLPREIILATSNDVEGETTALYLGRLLQPYPTLLTRPASGIPMGGELEYVDKGTLERALIERRALS